ncbi:conserved protein of unknown function [Candidatus Hydrogenisulfobacillus filiaventi]|uniref:Uncharacterized protein n=1 Tax=Candidatus Hydrogenisulfobacillus filiaventi TaxID=2707344 RepID=A0A6F8ZDB1_9FIRM|nr:hypothetical protein [Bacillota bacterium]CAB1127747.1 conserved protein of unknown function [Candidatus Hydrogenisulfobacillus filiaventi]
MLDVWDQPAAAAHLDKTAIEHEAARAWVERELSTVDRELAAYAERYGVPHPDGLERLIASGRIDGHPAWEDRLDWGNLLVYRERLVGMAGSRP